VPIESRTVAPIVEAEVPSRSQRLVSLLQADCANNNNNNNNNNNSFQSKFFRTIIQYLQFRFHTVHIEIDNDDFKSRF